MVLLACIALALLRMETDVVRVDARECGTEHAQPWRRSVLGAAVRTVRAKMRALCNALAPIRGPAVLLAVVALMLAEQHVMGSFGARDGLLLALVKFARAGGGNWSADATWSTTSGGSADTTKPTAADDVRLDASSGAVTIDAASVCRSLDCNGYTGTLTHNAFSLTIGDATAGASNIALRLVSGMTYAANASASIAFSSSSATQQTIAWGGKTPPNAVQCSTGSTGNYLLSDSLVNASLSLSHNGSTFNTNGQTVTVNSVSSGGSSTRVLTLGASTVTVSNAWSLSGSNLTFNANTSTIQTAGNITFAGGGFTYNTVIFTNAATSTITGANTFANLTRTGTATKTDGFSLAANQIVTTLFTATGNSTVNRLFVRSNTLGTTRTITAAAVSLTNVTFQDITGAGAATWTGTSLGDALGNSGITFDVATTQTNTGATGNWSDATKWTSRVPLPQDTVVVNTGSGTITVDMPRIGKDVSFAGFTGSASFSSTANSVFGNLTLGAGMTVSGTQTLTLAGRGAHTLTSAGKTFTQSVIMAGPGGTYTQQDAFVTAGDWTLTDGGWLAAGFNHTALTATISGTTTRALTMGAGTWSVTSTAAPTLWNAGTTTGLTFSGASATVALTAASANSRTFAGGGLSYGTLTYTVAGSTGALVVTGSNTFGTMNFSDASNARTLTLTSGTTTAITSAFNVVGASGRVVTLNASSGGSAASLVKSGGGNIVTDYLSIQDSAASPASTWFAGRNSTSVSGNSGWLFGTLATHTGTGGFQVSGAATITVTRNFNVIGAGGFLLSGVAGQAVTRNFDVVGAGGFSLSGTATITEIFVEIREVVGSGGFFLGGAATVSGLLIVTIEEAVRRRIVGLVPVRDLASTRVYLDKLPQKPTYPCVRVQLIDDPLSYHLRGPSRLRRARVQVDAYAQEGSGVDAYAVAATLARAIEGNGLGTSASGLSGWKGQNGVPEIVGAFVIDRTRRYDPEELRVVTMSQDFYVDYKV